MNKQQLVNIIQNHPCNKVKLGVSDIDGVLRGKYISKEKFLATLDGTLGFCDVVFGWDVDDRAYEGADFTGWHTGYPDMLLQIDPETFREIPWENNQPFFLGQFVTAQNEAVEICPRQLLQKTINTSLEMGYTPYFSQEFEWFNFQESPETLRSKGFRQLQPLTPGMFGYSLLRASLKNAFMADLFDLLESFDVPLEGLHTETGPGVYEAAIVYADALLAADRAILFKTAVKEIAYRHGIMATFMAKWNEDLPGCSGHVHQSLWDEKTHTNLFYSADKKISPLMEQYIAGQLYCLPHILPMFAPTVNSYKRLVEGAWAPTTLTWAYDNRTVALRVLAGGAKSTRLETRVVGSDTNPYLAIAACLAAGLYGIRHQLSLDQPATIGNGYADDKHGRLPGNLKEATMQMQQSSVAKELFGETFVQHFCFTRLWEWKQYAKAVSDWELKRYFEII